ncbi:hypothetical protein HF577_07430 [Pseudonocardia xinjiangensis]|uniref:Uncharacterized protein n=1 Tax=Pseudonocardia xinjiangensis TaxID=75289 RepID=A0ABX1RA76_9PSEU|nr:hypothetical protein [Pseudonocardia xinjiangensis]NMH76927.1 hypothetical protein [Pseudonocardia xinjiangensis]
MRLSLPIMHLPWSRAARARELTRMARPAEDIEGRTGLGHLSAVTSRIHQQDVEGYE